MTLIGQKIAVLMFVFLVGWIVSSLIFLYSFVIYFIRHRGSSVQFSGVNYGLKNDA